MTTASAIGFFNFWIVCFLARLQNNLNPSTSHSWRQSAVTLTAASSVVLEAQLDFNIACECRSRAFVDNATEVIIFGPAIESESLSSWEIIIPVIELLESRRLEPGAAIAST